VFLLPEGVDRQAGGAAIGRAAQDALACGIVHVPLLAGRPGIPLGKVVEVVVGQRGCRPLVGAAGDVAQGIVAAAVDRPALIGAGCADRIEPAQLVGLAVTVEVLVLRAAAGERALPQLAQVGVDIAVAVAASSESTGKRATADLKP